MRTLKKIAIIGAGVMGAGIARRAAQHGFGVVVVDLSEELVNRGLADILTTLTEAVGKKILKPEDVEQTFFRVHGTTDLTAAAACDLVIEAVFEFEKTKKDLFAKLDTICPPKTIFATNTSTLSVTELAKSTRRPARFGGMHFFYHAAKNHLVEIVPGAETSPETVEYLVNAAKLLGQKPIVVKDAPGFAVNRFFVPYLNESVRLFEEGVANIPTIDAAVKDAFGAPVGPFELMNLSGVALAYQAAMSLRKRLSKFYAPARTLERQAKKEAKWAIGGEADKSRFAEARERLYGVVIGLAALIVEEGIAKRKDIEMGAKVGLRWARGPFEIMDSLGAETARALVTAIAKRYHAPEIMRPM
jgi:enoyl-CoA hydratase/3-hydroxyacyl-CoA dehydrogenase